MVKSFDDIDRMIKDITLEKPKVLAIAAASEDNILNAVCEARNIGIIDAVLVGNELKIFEIAEEHGFDLHGFRIVNCEDEAKAAQIAVELVRTGEAQILMKGLLDSSTYLKAILDKEKGLRESKLISYIGLFEVEKLKKLLMITDPAINLEPDLDTKEIIMRNAIIFAHALGYTCPKVAFICPVEKVNPKMDSTIHAKTLVEKYSKSGEFLVGGPFALDNAISVEAARIKGITGPVAGNADILIVNDIGVGNVIYKSLVYFSSTRNAGVVIGTKSPVLMASRSDSTDTKLNSIKLGVLLAEHYQSLRVCR
jgi:Phosphotransacetylase